MKKKTKKKPKLLQPKTASYSLQPINNGYLLTVRAPKRPTFRHFADTFDGAILATKAIETGKAR
jgi:hypothetical protein